MKPCFAHQEVTCQMMHTNVDTIASTMPTEKIKTSRKMNKVFLSM